MITFFEREINIPLLNIYSLVFFAMQTFYDRKNKYMEKNLQNDDPYALLLQASKGAQQPLNAALLNRAYQTYITESAKSKSNVDFQMIFFIRLLYLLKSCVHPQYDEVFRAVSDLFKDAQFWLTRGETSQCYWSENHMICYLSSWYLWDQLNGRQNAQCVKLLTAFLETKSKYFFYESFSQVYNAYTLSALLNLYDFAPTLASTSHDCIDLCVSQFMEVHALDGSTFCASTRTYDRYKTSSVNNNFNKMMYLFVGYNKESGLSPLGAFISTSSYIPVNIDTLITKGVGYEKTYTLSNVKFDKIYKGLNRDEKTLFQWSAGNYFNAYVDDTLDLMEKFDLSQHSHFKLEPYDTILRLFPTKALKSSVERLRAFTDASDLTNIQYHLYNRGNYTLTALENYNRGKMGAQQLPWIANVSGAPVFTQAGKITSLGELNEAIGNSHMPAIRQTANVMLMMYQPYDLIKSNAQLANLDLVVYLYMNRGEFHQVIQNKNWIFGRKDDAYIAVYASAVLKMDKNQNYYHENTTRQGWVVIVGNMEEYGTFQNFQNDILQNTVIQFRMIDPSATLAQKLNQNDDYYYGSVKYKKINMEVKW